MTVVKLTGNFLATARCLIFADGGGVSWNFNPNTNTLTASATSGGTFLSSVGLADTSTAPIFTVSNSPLTANGAIDITLKNQNAAVVFAGPATGGAAQPTFRALAATDVPTLAYVTSIGSSNLSIGGTAAVPTVNLSGTQVTNIGLGGTALQAASVTNSVTGNGTAGSPLQLSGDSATPGNSFYYGTNSSGTKGYFTLASGTVTSLTGTANQIAVSTSTGAVTLSFPTNVIIPASTGIPFTVNTSGSAVTAQLGALGLGVGIAFVGGQAEMITTSTTAMGVGTSGSAAYNLYTNSVLRASVSNTGAFTHSAPTSGDAVTITNVAGANALVLAGNSAGTAVLRLNTQATTGTQTATFTATNKPGSGTTGPDKWIPVNLDGTVHYVPAFL
jgi:hypothetical protein